MRRISIVVATMFTTTTLVSASVAAQPLPLNPDELVQSILQETAICTIIDGVLTC
ncbi:hypothetical protein GCM10022419_016390 [Nonomuraea rosea]|uniref:Uncharacterized protein n=1 Tax=Nonomuraea rosea TaxID=638574 RepID=A0ABP6VNH7_9ACTN